MWRVFISVPAIDGFFCLKKTKTKQNKKLLFKELKKKSITITSPRYISARVSRKSLTASDNIGGLDNWAARGNYFINYIIRI